MSSNFFLPLLYLYKNDVKSLIYAQNTRKHLRSMRIAAQTIAGDGADIVTTKGYVDGKLDAKVDSNIVITGATKCKITYDSKGLVTGGADLAIADIPSGIERTSNKRSAWQTTPTDTAYPTEKLVKTSLDTKANTTVLTAHTGNTDGVEWKGRHMKTQLNGKIGAMN